MALTTVDKVKEFMGIVPTDTSQDGLISTLIVVLEDFLPRYCNRNFDAADYKEWGNGENGQMLWLDNFPINSITRVCMDKLEGGTITCVDAEASVAYFDMSSTQLTLTIVGGSNPGSDNITVAANPTITDAVAAINAVGKGWAATVGGDYGVRLTSDIVIVMGVYCLNAIAYYTIPGVPLYDVELRNAAEGILYRAAGFGEASVFVEYNGGYATIPNGLSFAATRIVAQVVRESPRDLALDSERIGDYAYTTAEEWLGRSLELNRTWIQPWLRTELW